LWVGRYFRATGGYGLSFGQRPWVVGAGSVHNVRSIPFEAILLKGAKAFPTLGLYWDTSLEF
jgi:hypothetical protein